MKTQIPPVAINREKIDLKSSPDKISFNEVRSAIGESLEQIDKKTDVSLEANSEKDPRQEAIERARAKIEQEAIAARDTIYKEKENINEAHVKAMTYVSPAQKDKEYKRTLNTIQTKLSPISQLFSEAIHNPTVERISDFSGSTLFRPNMLLAGSLVAFVSVTSVYILAHYNGFELSGSETIAAFISGWALGLVLDLTHKVFSRTVI